MGKEDDAYDPLYWPYRTDVTTGYQIRRFMQGEHTAADPQHMVRSKVRPRLRITAHRRSEPQFALQHIECLFQRRYGGRNCEFSG